jgi:hypothetical protein
VFHTTIFLKLQLLEKLYLPSGIDFICGRCIIRSLPLPGWCKNCATSIHQQHISSYIIDAIGLQDKLIIVLDLIDGIMMRDG